jgi:hypothetical protein
MAAPSGKNEDLLGRLRRELPRLLKERPEVRAEVAALLADHLTTREETNRILDEIRALREESNRRFEESNRRFDELMREMREEFKAVRGEMREEFKAVRGELRDHSHRMDLVVGGFSRRAGRNLEDAVAGTLRVGMGMRDLKPEDVRLRQKVSDADGLIGPPGRSYEYDLLVHDGEAWVFEVKSAAEPEDAERLALKTQLVEKQLGRAVRPVLATLDRPDDLVAACERCGVRLA